ncbi:tail fiber protein [Paenibacillus sp. FSL M7-1414]|uniref:tail fiber protein n=1 Tax=Paenibacillus sp. FSL M7-1414 TaxID=2921542 RepID=UPI0030FB0666
MSFTQKLPEWNAPGVEPSATQKQTGFQPGMKPPAQWFNWHLNWSYLALKELQEKAAEKSYVDNLVEELRGEIGDADIPDASLTVKGKVQLSNKIDGDSQSVAPTEKALNDARLAAQIYVDDKAWQKFPLTQDNGVLKAPANGVNLNTLTGPGLYYCSLPSNSPTDLPFNNWFVDVRVQNPTASGLIMQTATQYNTSTFYVRQKIGTTWTAWVLQTPEENLWGAL